MPPSGNALTLASRRRRWSPATSASTAIPAGAYRGALRVSILSRSIPLRGRAQQRAAADAVAALPAYQVALWPDGWDLMPDGSVSVRDTHAMAEARRWYALARRNGSRGDLRAALRLHGVFIPPAILDLTSRRFASEQVASVAVQLVAGDWVVRRRAELLRVASAALTERSRVWTGSRHGGRLESDALRLLAADLLGLCVREGLAPPADYGLRVRRDDGFGVCTYRVRVETHLDPYARARVGDALAAALIPWNRAVGRDPSPRLVISVELGTPAPGHPAG